MTIPSLLKAGLVFIGGAAAALLAIILITGSRTAKITTDNISLDNLNEKVKGVVDAKEKSYLKSFNKIWENSAIPAITESPILAPILSTSKDVSEAVDSIKSLPADQKSAICTQICGN